MNSLLSTQNVSLVGWGSGAGKHGVSLPFHYFIIHHFFVVPCGLAFSSSYPGDVRGFRGLAGPRCGVHFRALSMEGQH